MQICGTVVLAFVAFSAQSAGKLCKSPDFMKPFSAPRIKTSTMDRLDRIWHRNK